MIHRHHLTSLFQITTKFLRNRHMSSISDDILFEEIGQAGIITLNRPKALNALDLSMINKLYPKLIEWESTRSVVVIKGVGDKAFCAGGDVRAVVLAVQKGKTLGKEFFGKEYITNELIGRYRIPYVALIDGITMGGGVGLSVHGRYRVATERTLFAMPESQIGFFCDVGGTHFLPRLAGKLGLYLGLTGTRLRGSDVLHAGIATHLVESERLPALETALIQCQNDDQIRTILNEFNVNTKTDFSLNDNLDRIDDCFSADSVEGIYDRLENDGSEWAVETARLLNKMSPTSLKLIFRSLQLGVKQDLKECLQMEYKMALNCMANNDFCEGVRALLIDKDQNPRWNPADLIDVTSDYVDGHFKLPEKEVELKYKL